MKYINFKVNGIPTLDKYLPEKCFVNKDDIYNYDILIDTRTLTEYNNSENKFPYNIPVINESQHQFLHKHKRIAGIIVLYGLLVNSISIRKDILALKDKTNKPLVFGCSKGRLRSPFMYLYSRLLNVNAKIVKGGIRSL